MSRKIRASNNQSYKEERLSLSDLILFILHTNKGVIEGRTTLQKLIYLANIKVGDKLINRPKFIPHYYGPYSYEVALTLDQLVNLNFIDEYIKRTDGNNIGYIYKLSEDGKAIINNNKERYNIIQEEISSLLNLVKQYCHYKKNIDLIKLAEICKVHYINSMRGSDKYNNNKEDIVERGKMLGWEININNIDTIREFLKDFNEKRK
ncbi:MAG: hypothetical protein QXK74_07320 [Candidatus Nitrosocaldaceae archaeon]